MKNKSLKFISVILAAFFGLLVFANSVSAATSTATYTSTVKALANSQLGIMTWNITTPANSSYVMRAKSCTASDCSDKTAWTSCALASGDNGTDISGKGCMIDGQGYVQFQVDLTMSDAATSSPYIDDVTINNQQLYSTSFLKLISSPFDTSNTYGSIQKITWAATNDTTQGTVKFQIRTAPDNGGSPDFTNSTWCGPTDCSGTTNSTSAFATSYYTDKTGATAINSVNRDNSNDRWAQYATFVASTDGTVTPTLNNVTVQYGYNVPPAITGLSYTQNSSGTVSVPYTLTETYDDLGNIAHGTASFPIKALLFYEPDSGVTAPVLNNSQTGIITLTNTNSQPIPSSGNMLIDNELMTFDSAGCTGNQRNILTRGASFATSYPTTAASHTAGTAVFFNSSSAVQTINNFSATGTAGTTTSTTGNSFVWDPRSDATNNLNNNKLTGLLLKVVANDGDASTFNTIGQSSVTSAQTLDLLAPTFTTQYYSDSGLTTSLGANPKLKAGTYYIKISANESLSSTPTISINAEGTANDVTNGTTTLVSGNDYKYTRTITTDAAATGTTIEDFSISGTDSFSNVSTNVNPTNESTTAGYTDTTAPTFATQYYSDSGLTNSLGSNPRLKAGTYYIKVSANEALSSTPTISINAEGTANDVTNGTTTLVSGNDYKYTRTITTDSSAVGTTIEDFSISGTDVAGNTATNVNPTNESTTAGYTDTTAPTAAITYSTSNPVKSGASLTITATFNESMANSPVPKIAISGANTLSATDMTKTDATHYYYNDTVGAGNGTATVALSVGTDLAANVITSAPSSGATFTVDNTAPTTLGTATLSSYLNNNGNTTVSWTQTTEIHFQDYLVQRKTGAGGTFATIGSAITNIATISYADNSALAEGTYYYQVIAEDTAGNTTTSTTSAAFVVDKTPPVIQSFTSSSPNSNVNDPLTFYGTGDTIIIQAVFNENLGNGSTMTVKLGNTAGAQVLLNQVSGSTLSGTYTVNGPSNGKSDDSSDLGINQIISTSVSDLATNVTNTTTIPSGQNLSDNKDIIVDTVPPSLQSFSATAGNYKAGATITLTATYNKSVKAGSNIHVKINADGGNATIDLTTVSTATIAGTYTVQAGDNTQNLKVASIVSQSVSDIKNNQLTDTNMPSTNINDGVLIDTTSPVITFSDDVNSTPNQSDTVTIHVVETNQASDKYIFSADNVCNNKNYSSGTSFGSDTPITFNTETNNGKYICTQVTDTAGNIGYQASGSTLNIDITPPTGTILINRTLSSGQIQLTAADPGRNITGLQMRSVTYNDDLTACDFSSATWGDYTNTLDLNSSSALTKACVQYKDVAGNTTTLSATPPSSPASFQYYDVSASNNYRIFLSWDIPTGHEGSKGFYQYQIFQCSGLKDNDDCTPNTSGTPSAVISQESTNYKTILGLSAADKYCYQVRFASQDVTGTDYSALSDKQCVIPGSTSSSVTKDVAIQFPDDPVPDSELFASQATIHWNTVNANDTSEPLPASSQVCWRVHTTPTPNWNCRSYESYENTHAVTISKADEPLYDLMPDTEYDYQVYSKTSWGKDATADGPATFTTKDGPVIKNVSADPVGNTTATITWTTANKAGDDLASSSTLQYASSLDANGNLATPQTASCDSSDVISHTCTLSDLTIGTQYYYYVESTVNGNTSRDSANGDFYRFTTLSDVTPPVITPNPGNPLILTDTQAALSWETDKRATSWLLYDTTTHTAFNNFVNTNFDPTSTNRNPYASYLAGGSSDLSHTFIMSLDSLQPNTTYYYRMVSEDLSGNVAVSQEHSFTTLQIQEAHPDLTNPGNPLIAQYSDTDAIVYLPAANTDATSKICWDTASITDVDSCANNSEINTATKSHYYHLTNLTPGTTYYIMTKITDSATPTINFTSSNITFTTKKEPVFQHPPLTSVTNVATSLITDTNAIITFDTDQGAICTLNYGTAAGNLTAYNSDETDYNQKHSINLTGLTLLTKYYYKINCADNLGTQVSATNPSEHTFTTLAKQISHTALSAATHDTDPTITLVTDSEATVVFNAGTETDSKLCSGASSDIDMDSCTGLTPAVTNSKIHSYNLTGLTPAATYYVKMQLTDSEDNSDTYTTSAVSFTTLETQVNHIALSDAAHDTSPTVTMKTDTEATILFDAGTTATSKFCFATADNIDMDSCTGVSPAITNSRIHAYHLSSLTPDTKYYLRMKLTDSDDTSDTYTTPQGISFTTDESAEFQHDPLSAITSVANNLVTDTHAIVTFNTDQKATCVINYGKTSGAYTVTNSDETEYTENHSIDLSGLSVSTPYYYQITCTDNLNTHVSTTNPAEYSFTTLAKQVGHTPLAVATHDTNPVVTLVTDSEATITFNAGTTATSELCEATSAGIDMDTCTAVLPPITNSKIHAYHLTGLTQATTYYLKMKLTDSADSSDTYVTPEISFTTLNNADKQHPPLGTITSIVATLVTDENAVITFKTDQNALCMAEATTSSGNYDNPLIFQEDGYDQKENYTSQHSLKFTGLIFDTKYYYKLTCEDNLNTVVNNTNPAELSFSTLPKQTGHVLLSKVTHDTNPTVVTVTDSEAVITFDAGTTADSKLCLSSSAGINADTCTEIMPKITNSRIHSYHLTGLTPDSTNYIIMKLTDSEVNTDTYTTGEVSFSTPAAQVSHVALSKVAFDSDTPTISMKTDTEAVVTFNAGTTSNSKMCYALVSGIDMESCTGALSTESNELHTFHLTNLTASTPYFLRMKITDSEDSLDTYTTKEVSFTTLDKQLSAGEFAATLDKTPSQISNVAVGSITGESATITWNTDENANSLVSYMQEGATVYMMAGDMNVNKSTDTYSTSHTVIINNLTSNIKYVFSVLSLDVSGNIAQSAESSFTTKDASSISSIKVVSKAMGQADITWSTGSKISSSVDYGLTTAYGQTKEDSTQTNDHEIILSNLTPGQTYHFRVRGEDVDKNMFASSDITFQPNSPPKISDFKIDSIYEHGATVTCTTNVPTDLVVTYVDPNSADNSGFQGLTEMATEHKITLKNMTSGIAYSIKVKVRDENSNETEEDFPGFTTAIDTTPPVIDNVHTDSALTQTNNVQTIVTWKTDEESTSSLIYREGRAGEEKEVKNSDNLSTNHVIVVTTFKPGTVYNFRVKSIDASGNTAISDYFSFLTPSTKANIIQIITSNFLSIFGWTSKVGK